ncbi:MAG: hypothetical protein R2729_04745 [Bryobacteraceae bacterium]
MPTTLRRWTAIPGAALLIMCVAVAQQAERADLMMEAAARKERVDGDLKAAIEEYRKVASRFAKQPEVAAKALLQMGQCQEKLGQAEARKSYERVVKEYASAGEYAAQARTRLAALTGPRPVPGEMSLRRVFEDVSDRVVSISPDGRWLIHLRGRDYQLRDLIAHRSRPFTRLSQGELIGVHERPRFSPDSRIVAYAVQTNQGFEIRTAPVEEMPHRTVLSSRRHLLPAGWDSDGHRLIFRGSLIEEPAGLHALTLADGKVTPIKRGGGYATECAVSLDGTLLAFGWNSGGQTIRILNLKDGTESPAIEHPSGSWGLVFASHNQGLYFFSNRRGTPELWYQPLVAGRAHGSPEHMLSASTLGQEPVGLTRDGILYFRKRIDMLDSYSAEYELSSGKWRQPPAKLAPRSTGQTKSTAFTQDGKGVSYFKSPIAGAWQPLTLVVRALNAGQETEIRTDLSWVEWHAWFPGQKAILAQGERYSNGESGIFRFDLSTGRSTLLRPSSGGWSNRGAVSPDGGTVYLSGSRPSRIVAIDLATRTERDLVTGSGLSAISLSPDGNALTFSRREGEAGVLEVINVDGSGRREVHRATYREGGLGGLWLPTWLQDGRTILFATGTGKVWWPAGMKTIPFEGGTPRDVGLSAAQTGIDGTQIGWPVWHPNGRHVAFDAGEIRNECWALDKRPKAGTVAPR